MEEIYTEEYIRKVRAFVLELNELTRKYGLAIGGCGDCGSPWVVKTEGEDWDLDSENSGYCFKQNFEEELGWVTTGKFRDYSPIKEDSIPNENGWWHTPGDTTDD